MGTVRTLYTNIRYNNKISYNDSDSLAQGEADNKRYLRILYLILQETYVVDIC